MYIDTIKDLKQALLVDYQRYEQLSSTEQLKLSRMTNLLEQLDKSTKELKQGLKTEINGHLENTGKIAYNELFYEYESKNTAINFTILKSEELKTIIETPVANYKLSERLNDGVAERLRSNIKSELTRVFLLGYSYKQTAARLAEIGYSSYRRALNITRTEAGRVQAIARQKSQMEAMKLGVEFEKEWISTLDNRTRSEHAKLDGQRVKPDEDFEVSGLKAKQPHMFGVAAEDCNCRCRTVSRLKNDKSALLRRDNETGEVGKWKNYAEWAESKYKTKEKLGFEFVEKQSGRMYNKLDLNDYSNHTFANLKKVLQSATKEVAAFRQETGIDLYNEKFIDIKNRYDDNKAKFVKYLYEKRHYSVLPTQVLNTDGMTPLYRGVVNANEAGFTGADFVDRFKNGPLDISGANRSAFGRGIYFGKDQRLAATYAKNGEGGEIIEAFLPSDANMTTVKAIKDFYTKSVTDSQLEEAGLTEIYNLLYSNKGMDKNVDIWSAITGHDGIISNNGEIISIFNRGILRIKE